MLICVIYDTKAYNCSPLFCAFDEKHAERVFACSLRDDSPCVLYPSDYELRVIGELDENNAEVFSLPRSSDDDNKWKYMEIPVSELIPDKYKRYCLDGTFDIQK